MALIVSRWRMLLAIAVLGSALAFAHRGYWVPTSVIGALLVLRAACRVAGELAATRRMLRGQPAAGKHRKPPERPYTCSRCGSPGVTVWSSEGAAATGRALGMDLVCDQCLVAKLRLVAALGGAGVRALSDSVQVQQEGGLPDGAQDVDRDR